MPKFLSKSTFNVFHFFPQYWLSFKSIFLPNNYNLVPDANYAIVLFSIHSVLWFRSSLLKTLFVLLCHKMLATAGIRSGGKGRYPGSYLHDPCIQGCRQVRIGGTILFSPSRVEKMCGQHEWQAYPSNSK